MKKRILAALMAAAMLLSVGTCAAAESSAKIFLYKEEQHIWHVSPHYMGLWGINFDLGDDACMFRLTTHDEDGNVTGNYATYCVDRDTRTKISSLYERKNLEDSGYFTQAQAEHIRSILYEGYWPNGENTLRLAKNAGLTHPEKLTNAEALSATQAAIWHYSNNLHDYSPYACTSPDMVVFSYTNSVYDDTTVDWQEPHRDVSAFGEYIPDTAQRIQMVYNYLIGLEGTKAGEVIWSFGGEHVILSRIWQRDDASGSNSRPSLPESSGGFWEDLWEQIFGNGWQKPQEGQEGKFYYQILARFRLKGTSEGLRSLKLTAQLMDSSAADANVLETKTYDLMKQSDKQKLHQDPEGYYTVAFSYPLDSAEFAAQPDVKLRLVGEQDVENDVYLYMPADEDGGREQSQTMAGFAAGRTPIDITSVVPVSGAATTVRGRKYMDEQLCREPFTFELIDVTDPAQPRHCGYAQNDRNGDFAFASVHYKKAGTYLYQVRELAPQGVFGTDPTVYTLQVKVEDDDGHLVAQDYSIVSPAQRSNIVFNNCGINTLSVQKQWNVLEGAQMPEEVKVTLLKNGLPYETVQLTAADGWTYTWEDLATGSAVWSVQENPMANCETTVVLEGNTFIITNTLHPSAQQEDLPQTGDSAAPLLWLEMGLASMWVFVWMKKRQKNF